MAGHERGVRGEGWGSSSAVRRPDMRFTDDDLAVLLDRLGVAGPDRLGDDPYYQSAVQSRVASQQPPKQPGYRIEEPKTTTSNARMTELRADNNENPRVSALRRRAAWALVLAASLGVGDEVWNDGSLRESLYTLAASSPNLLDDGAESTESIQGMAAIGIEPTGDDALYPEYCEDVNGGTLLTIVASGSVPLVPVFKEQSTGEDVIPPPFLTEQALEGTEYLPEEWATPSGYPEVRFNNLMVSLTGCDFSDSRTAVTKEANPDKTVIDRSKITISLSVVGDGITVRFPGSPLEVDAMTQSDAQTVVMPFQFPNEVKIEGTEIATTSQVDFWNNAVEEDWAEAAVQRTVNVLIEGLRHPSEGLLEEIAYDTDDTLSNLREALDSTILERLGVPEKENYAFTGDYNFDVQVIGGGSELESVYNANPNVNNIDELIILDRADIYFGGVAPSEPQAETTPEEVNDEGGAKAQE